MRGGFQVGALCGLTADSIDRSGPEACLGAATLTLTFLPEIELLSVAPNVGSVRGGLPIAGLSRWVAGGNWVSPRA